MKPGSGERDIQQFLRDLKQIDTEHAPREIKQAVIAMIGAVESNLVVRHQGGDVDAANDRVAMVKRQLLRTLEQHRGQPY